MLKPTRLYYAYGLPQNLPYNQWNSQYVPQRMIPEYLSALTDMATILNRWDKYNARKWYESPVDWLPVEHPIRRRKIS